VPPRDHHYEVHLLWTGNSGTGTRTYAGYGRAHELRAPGKPPIAGSSDPSFRGESSRWSPEELLVASLAACHQLWYLHLCADAGVVVMAYEDRALGMMREHADGSGEFERVILRPLVTIAPAADVSRAYALHEQAHARCFIARSVRFPVSHEPTVQVSPA
jgi:organic hydroperoxide reductase OsmC/OhrA